MSSGVNGVEKLVIIGSGPAGWTAAIYAARANLSPLCVVGIPKSDPSPILPGGQLMLTTEVENYPGFPHGVSGPELMQHLQAQAERFGTRVMQDDIVSCDFTSSPFALSTADGVSLKAHSVIIATGAVANWVGLADEMRLARSGGGVSACAVCDGALPAFRGAELGVVGGGDTAMEEATYLTKFASTVHLIHRRGEFRASKAMQERLLAQPNVKVHWHQVVVGVEGGERIEAVQMEDVRTKVRTRLPLGGLFIAIGHSPATAFLKGTGVQLDPKGYVALGSRSSATNIDGVFAAGDVCDSVYRQAITAAGMGCQSALDAERWLAARGVH